MKGLHNHTALLILAVAVMLVVGSVYGYMRYALTGSVSRAVLAKDIVRVEQANKNQEQSVVSLYESTSADRKKLSEFYIPADRAVDFIEALEDLGKQAGSVVTISSIEADKVASAPGAHGLVKAHVESRGSWQAIMKTLLLAEFLPYASNIDHVRADLSVLPGDRVVSREWRLVFDINVAIK